MRVAVLAATALHTMFHNADVRGCGAGRPAQQGLASGANNALRELGGVLGVAVLGSVFAARGGYGTPQTFVDGTVPALWVGTVVLFVGAAVALLIPRRRHDEVGSASTQAEPDLPVQPTRPATPHPAPVNA